MKVSTALIGAVVISGVTILTTKALTAANTDLPSIKQSTSIQHQAPEHASQSQKECYQIMSDVSLSQFSALKSKEEGHKRAMKNCGINP